MKKFKSKNYSFNSFSTKFNSKIYSISTNWLYSIQWNIHSIRKRGYWTGLTDTGLYPVKETNSKPAPAWVGTCLGLQPSGSGFSPVPQSACTSFPNDGIRCLVEVVIMMMVNWSSANNCDTISVKMMIFSVVWKW